MQIVKYLRDATHELRYTTMVALLQPAPETYELFDDVLLLSDGVAGKSTLWRPPGTLGYGYFISNLCSPLSRQRRAMGT